MTSSVTKDRPQLVTMYRMSSFSLNLANAALQCQWCPYRGNEPQMAAKQCRVTLGSSELHITMCPILSCGGFLSFLMSVDRLWGPMLQPTCIKLSMAWNDRYALWSWGLASEHMSFLRVWGLPQWCPREGISKPGSASSTLCTGRSPCSKGFPEPYLWLRELREREN